MRRTIVSVVFIGLFVVGAYAQQIRPVQERAALAIKEASVFIHISPEQEAKLLPIVTSHIEHQEMLMSSKVMEGVKEANQEFLKKIQQILSVEQFDAYLSRVDEIDENLRAKGLIRY